MLPRQKCTRLMREEQGLLTAPSQRAVSFIFCLSTGPQTRPHSTLPSVVDEGAPKGSAFKQSPQVASLGSASSWRAAGGERVGRRAVTAAAPSRGWSHVFIPACFFLSYSRHLLSLFGLL